jgi:hypothetical protein
MERFQSPRPDKLVTSLADAIQEVLSPATTVGPRDLLLAGSGRKEGILTAEIEEGR